MFTLSEENYLKAIYHLQLEHENGVNTNAIAEQMDTKASSVTDMVKKLADKELVDYIKYQGVTLSKKGEKVALRIVRKHRLWEVFLVEKLGFKWDEVHEVAEQLEHIKSDKLIKELDKYLEYPTEDPHGDPIPDNEGAVKKLKKVCLAELDAGDKCMCVGVKDSSSDFLKYLDKNGIKLGKKIKVLDKEHFDGTMLVKIKKNEFALSSRITNNLYVKKF
jgi:DtxR family Mn-dependent transcriptional regulator